jgi:hypothetical protein
LPSQSLPLVSLGIKALDEFIALGIKEDEAFNRKDAGALPSLFTEDALLVAPYGIFTFGQKWHTINQIGQADQLNAEWPRPHGARPTIKMDQRETERLYAFFR